MGTLWLIASAVDARLGRMGFLKCVTTDFCSSVSRSIVVLPATAIAMSATFRIDARLSAMQPSASVAICLAAFAPLHP